MTSGGNNFNDFPENQLTKFHAETVHSPLTLSHKIGLFLWPVQTCSGHVKRRQAVESRSS